MKARSPVLGYNHNVRYGGRMWHVQTEDSGVQNPHIFTHLFADGTIIGSKKTNYDVDSEVTAVQKLMQTQHKLMLRDLKSGTFDEKIEKIFGPIVRDPGDAVQAEAVHPAEAATGPLPRVDPPVHASVPKPDVPPLMTSPAVPEKKARLFRFIVPAPALMKLPVLPMPKYPF